MSKQYYAIQKKDSNELTHWKYIKRVRKNGKWKYYYDKESLQKDVKDVVSDIQYEITSPLKDAKDNFEWGYERGSKKDPNTGSVLNKTNADPDLLRQLRDTTDKYRRSLATDPFYRGVEKDVNMKQIKNLENEINELNSSIRAAESFMGKLGQFTGRKVTEITYNKNKVEKWIHKKLNIH